MILAHLVVLIKKGKKYASLRLFSFNCFIAWFILGTILSLFYFISVTYHQRLKNIMILNLYFEEINLKIFLTMCLICYLNGFYF